jgi:hypothetical protein
MPKSQTEPPIGGPLLSQDLAELAQYRTAKEKINVEFSRYKQDCRKRALDLAAQTNVTGKKDPVQDDVLKLADNYYTWLISIPDTD